MRLAVRITRELSEGQSSRVAWSVVGAVKYGRPLNSSLHAGPWTFIRCVMDRSRHTLSITRPNRGRCSQTRSSGVRDAIAIALERGEIALSNPSGREL